MIITQNSTSTIGTIEVFTSKVCTKCGIEKKLEMFSPHKKGFLNRRTNCKKCTSKENGIRIKEHYANNKELYKERNKKNYEKHKEKYKERHKTYWKEYSKKNKEKIKAYNEMYRKTDQRKISAKKYIYKRRMYLKNIKDIGNYTLKEWEECLRFFDNKDAYTGEVLKNNITIDHILPITKGGNNYIYNLVPCTNKTNSSKNSSYMYEWYKEQDFYNEQRLLKILYWVELNKMKKYR